MPVLRNRVFLKIAIAAGLGLLTAYGALLAHQLTSSSDAAAEADRLDPGWRLEELEKKREVIPDEENSALVVLAAAKLWPARRGTEPDDFWAEDGIEQSIADLPPEMQLNASQEAALKKELGKDASAVQEARKLRYLSRGRFPSSGSREDGTAANAHQEARRSATLLLLDSILLAQDKEADGALNTALGILNSGRSIGDEAYTISQLIRIGCTMLAIRNMERVLGQGEPSEVTLLSVQHLIENETREPLLLLAARGSRADTFQRMAISKLPFWQPMNPHAQFQLQTKCVEVAKAAPEEQLSLVQQLKTGISKLDPGTALWLPTFEKIVQASLRNQAFLRCVFVALATERYRRAHGRWPDSLAALVPEFLRELPTDPYNGLPLKFRRLTDGIVIYSVGPDGQDNDGKIDRQNPTARGTDIGFQLWDVAQRRQPWRPIVKKTESEEEK